MTNELITRQLKTVRHISYLTELLCVGQGFGRSLAGEFRLEVLHEVVVNASAEAAMKDLKGWLGLPDMPPRGLTHRTGAGGLSSLPRGPLCGASRVSSCLADSFPPPKTKVPLHHFDLVSMEGAT